MRDWWLRALLVLQRPRPVFVALRDDGKESLSDRAEPVLLIVILAGIALALASGTASHLMDDSSYDGLVTAVWAFVVGGVNGAFGYFFLGALVHVGARALGSQGTYRRSRHVLAFAAVPIALSLALWPVKLALYGDDVFRRGGHDAGSGSRAFTALTLVFVAWAVALLVVGVRSVHGWTWGRAAAACLIAAVVPVALWLALSL
jgi:hypothetical protein